MKDRFRTYQYFILGSLGGLAGWFIPTMLLRNMGEPPSVRNQAGYGILLGAMIGLCIAAREGLTTGSLRRLIRYGSVSLVCGAAAGAIALPLAQAIYASLLGASAGNAPLRSFLIGALCWVLLGCLIGLGETINKGTQSWKGLLGGAIGGLIGGMICETSRIVSHGNATASGQRLLAVSLMLLGGATGASIAFVTTMLKRAWLEVADGKLAGRVFDVTKFVASSSGKSPSGMIGSDEWSCQVYLPGANFVLPHHATIGLVNGFPTLTVTPEARKQGATLVNGEPATNCGLRDGDRLRIGTVELLYRQKRRAG